MVIHLPNGGWAPRRYQRPAWDALERGVRNQLLVWHRRSGKDDLVLHWTATQALQHVGNYWHMLPEKEQARKAIWTAVNPHTGKRRIDEAFPRVIRRKTIDDEMIIHFINGSTWQVLGSDAYDSHVGAAPRMVAFSEWDLTRISAYAYVRPILAENNGTALFITTPRGKGNAYSMYQAYKDDPNWYVEILPATQTGVFSEEQLRQELDYYIRDHGEAVGRAMFNQEYMCSFDSAIVGAIYGEEMALMRNEKRMCRVPYDRRYPVHTAWDIGFSDDTCIWMFQVIGTEIRVIDFYSNSLRDVPFYANELRQRPYSYGIDLLPHDGAHDNVRGPSVKKQLIDVGRYPRVVDRASSKIAAINATRGVFSRMVIDDVKCSKGIDALCMYSWRVDKSTEQLSRQPKHDWSSHAADAMQTLALGLSYIDQGYQTETVVSPNQYSWVV